MRNITLVDYGRVAMSNPLWQSLFTHEDSLNNGKLKAEAAAENLKRIFPGVVVFQTLVSLQMTMSHQPWNCATVGIVGGGESSPFS